MQSSALLRNHQGQYTADPKEMVDLLADQFSSVFSTPMDITTPDTQSQDETINNIKFDQKDIIAAIDELSTDSAPGPDGFPSLLLKKCKMSLSLPLCMLWRKSLTENTIPDTLKRTFILPKHKDGNKAEPKNYRPIALTSHIIKIFEKIMRNNIVNFLEEHQLFNNSQHGFRSGRSCLSQLLLHYDKIITLMEEGKNVDVIYLDFSKAFDKVDFKIVLKKLNSLGIKGKVAAWIESFLTNRTQTIIINGVKSTQIPAISGVPQGSVLGPLIFLILIGDIDKDLRHSTLQSFADDTRVMSGIKDATDVNHLQDDLNTIYSWALANNMEFNSSKFEVLRCGKDKEIKTASKYLSSNGTQIENQPKA